MYQEEEHLHFSNSSTTYAMKGAIFWSLLFLAETEWWTLLSFFQSRRKMNKIVGKEKAKLLEKKYANASVFLLLKKLLFLL